MLSIGVTINRNRDVEYDGGEERWRDCETGGGERQRVFMGERKEKDLSNGAVIFLFSIIKSLK